MDQKTANKLRQEYAAGATPASLADKYNLSISQTYRIINGESFHCPVWAETVKARKSNLAGEVAALLATYRRKSNQRSSYREVGEDIAELVQREKPYSGSWVKAQVEKYFAGEQDD